MSEQADWDIVTGVGVTALWAAGARAIASSPPDPLMHDPYAAGFVHAVAGQLPSPIPTTPEEATRDPGFPWFSLATYIGVRSRYFDACLGAGIEAGIRQVAIVAAGLDVRAFRLGWPPGTTVYEVDAPLVIAFKEGVLGERHATPRCDRRTVASDLRDDWPSALRRAGFDPALPTSWLAEGLLPYLPDDAKRSLLTQMHRLSAPGSRIAAEHFKMEVFDDAARNESGVREIMDRVDEDIVATWASDQPYDPAGWLHGHGWAVAETLASTVAAGYGRSLDGAPGEMGRAALLINATRNP